VSRIPQAFIQDLLSRTDIVEVVGQRVELKRAGKEFKGLSPFTNEKSPSFFVSPAKQMFFCFSSGKNGTAINFLMENDRLSFVEAVEELAKRAGLTVPREGGRSDQLVLEGPLDALAAAERVFRAQLRTHQPAIDYLKKRGVSGDTARLYNIGFAPDAWDTLAREFKDPAHAITAGLLKKKEETGRVFDVFRNRVMFPIRDTRGRVIAFGGRTLANDPAKYLNSPETPLFHKGRNLFGLYEAKQSTKSELPFLMVVEGYMDTVMLAQHGIRNVVATLGTATTREHLALLFKSTARVVFCFDGDRAGRSAAWRALEQALPEVYEGRECRFMFLPEGHDPDTLVQEIGAEAFLARVEQAISLSDFLLGELGKQVNLGTLDGRARLAGLARPHLEKMREGPLRTLIVDELARQTRMSRADLDTLLAARERPAAAAQGRPPARAEAPGARPVKRALQLLLERPELALQVEHVGQLAASPQPGMEILVEAIEYFHDNPHCRAGQLLELWRDTPKGAALNRILGVEEQLDEAAIGQEFADTIAHLRRKALRGRAETLLTQARERDLSPAETAELEQITRQLSDWSRPGSEG
jgi:DNA primase